MDGAAVTYPGALGRRDLRIVLTPDGTEDFVVLPDAAAGGSYVDELTLPAGLSARDGDAGVEILDASGKVVGTIAHGWASDAAAPTPSLTPVSVRLLAEPALVASTTVAVEVSIDPAWLAEPSRVAPITIDPTISFAHGGAPSATDTMVLSNAATTNYGTFSQLWVGAGGGAKARTYLKFGDLPAPGGPAWVADSKLVLTQLSSQPQSGAPGTPRPLRLGAPTAAWTDTTLTWANQPAGPFDLSAGTTTPNPPLSAPGALSVIVDTTELAQAWLSGLRPNNGIVIADAAEDVAPGAGVYHFFGSTQGNALQIPVLQVTYGTGTKPPAAAPDAGALADGAVVGTATPSLSVAKVTDPDPSDVVRYWFRATPSPDAETGAKIDSGWFAPGDAGFPGCPTTGTTCAYAATARLPGRRRDVLVARLDLGPRPPGGQARLGADVHRRPPPGSGRPPPRRPVRPHPGEPRLRQPRGRGGLAGVPGRGRRPGAHVRLQLRCSPGRRRPGRVLLPRRQPAPEGGYAGHPGRQLCAGGRPRRPHRELHVARGRSAALGARHRLHGPLGGLPDGAPGRVPHSGSRPTTG